MFASGARHIYDEISAHGAYGVLTSHPAYAVASNLYAAGRGVRNGDPEAIGTAAADVVVMVASAAAGGAVAKAKVHLNSNAARSRFGIYEIKIDEKLYKVGKADLNRVTKVSGWPTRLHQQVRKLREVFGFGAVDGKVVQDLGVTTTAEAKAAEAARIRAVYEEGGAVPPGNEKSFRP